MAFDFEDDNYENIFSEAITINKYTSQGFEFSSDHKTLLMAPKNIIEFEVPQYVVSIGPSAFKGCKMLERIVLHNSIRNIAKDAFEYCSALKIFEFAKIKESEITVWNGEANEPVGGSGTEDDPYQIFTAEELAYVIENGSNSKYYKIVRNIYSQQGGQDFDQEFEAFKRALGYNN